MKPLFFGNSSQKLFGLYHPPLTANENGSRGVLLCYPGMQEYNASHWAFRRFAAMLARSGLHAFRFDYFATGDSAGESEAGRTALWVDNILQAATEFRDLASLRTISIVGMRLGATLALRACTQGLVVRDLVLWEPVVSGREYLAELDSWHRRRTLLLLQSFRARGMQNELLGFPLTAEMRADLAAIEIRELARPSAERVFIAASEERPLYRKLKNLLSDTGLPVKLGIVQEAESGAGAGEQERALLASQVLVEMTREIAARTAVEA